MFTRITIRHVFLCTHCSLARLSFRTHCPSVHLWFSLLFSRDDRCLTQLSTICIPRLSTSVFESCFCFLPSTHNMSTTKSHNQQSIDLETPSIFLPSFEIGLEEFFKSAQSVESPKFTLASTSQQPWHTACKAASCPIKYPHNFGLAPSEPPGQFPPEPNDQHSMDCECDERLESGDDDYDDEEDMANFPDRSEYSPPEIDSLEHQIKVHESLTRAERLLLQAFYSAHGGKRQYYGYLVSGVYGTRRKRTKYVRRDNSKSEHRILAHR